MATVGLGSFPSISNYGPITAPFAPAATCTNVVFQTNVPFIFAIIMGGHEDCYPGSLLYQLHYGVEGVGSPFYTPAIFCPYGYATAAAWTASSYGGPPPGDGESAYYCCPLCVCFVIIMPPTDEPSR